MADEDIYREAVSPEDADAFIAGVNTAVTHPEAFTGPRPGAGNVGAYKGGREALANIGGGAVQTDAFLANEEEENRRWEEAAQMRALGTVMGIGAEAGERIRVEHARQERFGKAISQFAPFMLGEWDKHPERREAAVKIYGEDAIREYEGLNAENKDLWIGMKWSDAVKDEGESGGEWQTRRFKEAGYPTDDEDLLKGGYGSWWRRDKKRLLPALQQQAKDAEEDERYVDAMISGKEIPESLQGLRAGFMRRVRPESLAKVQRVAAWAKQNLGYARGADWASTKLRRLNANEMTESLAELISDGKGGIDPEMRGLAERMLDGFAKGIKYGDSPSAVGEFMIAAGRLLHSVGNSLSEGDALRDAERKEAEVRELEDRLAGKSRGSEFMERMQREGGVQSEFMRRNAGTFMNTERGRAEAAALEKREAEERKELEARLAKAREDAAALREKADEEMAVRVARGMVSNATDVATELDKSRPWYWQATVGAARVVGEVAGQTSAYLAGTAAAAGMAAIPGVGTAAAAAAAIGIGSSAELMRAREEEYNRNLAQGMSPEAARNEAMITGTINAAVEMMPGSALGGAGATSLLRWGSRRGSRIATEILNWGTRSTARAWGVETGAAVLDESILEPLGQGILQWGASNACDALGVPHGKTKEFRKNFDELSAILNDPVQLAGTMIFCGVLSAGGAVKIGKHTGSIRATVDYMKVQREHLEAEGFTAEQTEQVMAQGEGKARAELCRKFEEYNREHDGEATLRRKLAAAQRMKEEGRALDYTGIMSITKEGKTVGEALQEAMKRSYGRYVRQGMLPDVQRNEDGSVHVRKLREGTGEVEYEMDCSEEEANNVVAVEMRDVERRQRERIREEDLEGYDLRRAILKATEREVGAGMQKAAEGKQEVSGIAIEDITKHVGPEIAERIRKEGRVTFEIAQDITAWAKGMIDGLTGQGMSEAEARASVRSDAEASGHAQTLGWWADFADNFARRAEMEGLDRGRAEMPVFTVNSSYGLDGSRIMGDVLYTTGAAGQSHSSILEDVSEAVLKDLVRQRAEVLMNEDEGRSAEDAAEQAWEELAAKVERANEAVAKADPEAKLVRVSREKDGRIERMSVVEGVSKLAVAKFLGSEAVPVWLKEFQDLSDGLLSAATAIGTVQKAYAAALEAEPEKLRDMEGLLGKMGVAVRNVFAEARLEARERTATVASTAKEEARAQGPGGVGGEGFSKVRAEQEEADREQEERERARVGQEGQDRERTDEGARVAYESEEDAGEAAGEGTENAPADMRKLFVGGTCVYNKAGGYYVGLIRKADIRLGLAQVKQGEKGRYGEIAGKELTGDFEPTAAPLYIWLRRDGTAELISGRHRFSKMMEDERVVAHLCYVFREDAEHNEKWAKMLDYENNMRDDQADEKTAAIYIREMPQADEELYRKGLLRNNSRSKRGLFIGRHARQALFERFLSDNISAKDTETLCRLTYNLRVEEKRIDEIQGLAASAFVGGKGWEYTVGLIQALAAAEGIEEVKQGMFDFGSEWQATAEKFAKFIELSLKAITAYQSAARAGMKTSGADKEKAALMGYTTSNDEAQAWKVQALAEARAKYEMAGSHREIIEAAVIWDGKSKIDPVPKILRDYAREHFGSEEDAEKANEEPEDDGMGDLFSANMSERRGGERVVRMKDGSTAVVTRAGDVDPNMSAFVIGKHAENWEKYAERAFEGRDDGMMRAELDISEAKLKEDKLLIPRDFKGWLSDDLGYDGEADSVQPIVLTLWHKYHEKEGVPEALRRDTRQFIEDVKNEAEVKDKERKADIRWAVKAGTELLKEAQRMGSLKKAGKMPAKDRRMLKAILATAAYEPGLWARKPLQDLLKARALTADGNLTLGDIFDCPALFEAYPYLSDLPVVIQELQGLLGAFFKIGKKWNKDPKKAWIEVTPNVSDVVFKSVLVHEVQHAIQDIEGFDYGTYKGIKEKGLSKDEAYWLMPGEIESRNVSRRMMWGPLERYGTAFNETLEFPGRALVSRKKKGSGKAKGADVWVAFSASMERRAEVKNLGAVHILPAYSLEQADRLGGMPVPSVAITRLDRPYQWGDTEEMVTLVGSPDLVDPARGAEVYSRDAWTGRVPEFDWDDEQGAPIFYGLEEDEEGESIPSVGTLENLTEYMAETKKRGAEAKSRDYEPLGVVRALTAERLPSMEAIKKNRDRLQSEDEHRVRHEEVMKLDEMLREDYDVYLGDDEWRAVFEAVADLEEVTEESVKEALEDWTDADGKPSLYQLQKSEALEEGSEWLTELAEVVNRLRDEKRDYFEALPMRAVKLSDWKLALVSKAMDESIRERIKDLCEENGIEYREYERFGYEDALKELVGSDLSFSMSEVEQTERVMRILQWHRENEAEGHAVAEEWGKFARILALRSAGGGAGGSLQGSEVMARMVALLAATRRVLPRDWRNARGVSAMLAWAGWYAKMAEAGEVQGTDILKGAVYEKVLAGLKEEAEVKAAQGGEAAVKAWLRDNMGVKLDTMTERLAGKCRAMIDRYICGRMREDMLRSIERLYPEREPGQQVRMGKLPADTYRYIRLVKEALSMNEAWVRAGAARADEEAALAAKLRRGDLSAEQKERYAAQLAELRDTAVNELADEVERLQAAAEDEERSEAERKEAQLKAHVLSIYACWDKRGYAECVSAAEDFRRVTQEGREVWDERQKERRDKMAYIKERVRKGKGWATSGEKMNEKIEERAGKDSKAKDVSLTSGLAYTSMAGKLYAAAKKFGGWFVSKYTRRIADMHKELKAAQDDNSTWLFRELARVSGRNTVAGISDFIREASEIAATGIEVEQVQRRVFRISGKSLAEWLVMSAEEREAERARLAAEGKANERLRRDIPSEEILEELEIDYANDRNAGFARKEYIYITESKEKHEIRSSKLGVLQAILTAEQPYYDHLMADNGITEAVLERMKEYVGPELLALGYGMRERLAEKRGAVAAMHERIYGVPFDAHANYFPGKFENEGTADLEGDGKVQAGSSGMPGRPGSMKTRRIHYRKIDWAASALDSFCTVLRQQDNWLITGDFIAEWGDMFRDKDFAQEMIGNLGRKWIEFMKADIRTLADARDAELSLGAITRMVGAVCSAAAKTRLAFNPVTIVKNATSLLNCWVGGQIPITEISESGAARVLDERGVGLLEFLAGARGEFTLKDIAAQDFIRVRTTKREGRIHEAINEGAREKGAGTRMRHALAGVEGAALRGQEIGMAGIEKADVGGNILSAMMLANAVYRSLERDSQARHLSREEKRRVALEYAQKALDYVAQPFTAGQKVTAANKASWGGVLANATMYLFRSEQLAKFGMAVADMMSGEAGRAARGSAYFLLVGGSAWLAGQVCLYLLGELGRALTGGDEPEDLFKDSEDFLKNFVASGVAGEIAVVPFIGEAVNAGVRRAAGLRVYMQGDTWGTAVAPFRRFAKAETPAEEVKSVCGMLQSAASVGGAVGIYARPVKSLTDLLLLVGGMKNIPEKVSGRFVKKKG